MAAPRKTLWYPEGMWFTWALCLPALLGLLSVMVVFSLRVELRSPLYFYYYVLSVLSLLLVLAGPTATAIAAIRHVRQGRSHHLAGLAAIFTWAAIVTSALLSVLTFLLVRTALR